MASGRFDISAENQYVNGYVEWTQSALNSNTCTSNLNLKAYLHRTNNYSSSINNQSITRKFFVSGDEFGTTENISITLPSNQNYVLFYERDITIYHNEDGSRNNLEIGFQSIYNGSAKTSFTVPKTTTSIDLDTIPRYPGYVLESSSSKTEHTINVNWSTDSIADYVWYSINGGSWIGVGSTNAKTGNYTITGLNYNTEYTIKTRIRRKDSGLTGDSGEITVRTYDIPYAYPLPNFVLGNSFKVDIYNPLSRSIKVFIYANGGEWIQIGTITGTSINPSTNLFLNSFLEASPNNANNTYAVKCVCDTINSEWTRYNGRYTIPNTPPEFSNFAYLDCDTNIVTVTGSNQYIVKNKSNLRVKITSSNKMVAKNYATPSRYEISCANRTKSLNYSANDTYVDLGTINSSGQMNIVVKAYDSRGFFTQVTKQINVIDYTEVNQENALYRINNFEIDSRLLIKGTFNLLNINNIAKNTILEIKYRCKEINDDYPASYTTITPTINGNKYECNLINLDLDNSKSFLFEIVVRDKLGSYSIEMLLSEGIPIMFINKTKRNIGVGTINKHKEGTVQATDYYFDDDGKSLLEILEPSYCSMRAYGYAEVTSETKVTSWFDQQQSGNFSSDTSTGRLVIPKGTEIIEITGLLAGCGATWANIVVHDEDGNYPAGFIWTNCGILHQPSGNEYFMAPFPTKIVKLNKEKSHYVEMYINGYDNKSFELNAGFSGFPTFMQAKKIK